MHQRNLQLIDRNRLLLRSPAGITVLEVLLTTGLGLLTLAAFTSFNRFQLFSLRNQATQNQVQMTARNAIDLLSRDIRRGGRNPTCAAGVTAIADAKQHSIRILSDLDGSGAVDGADEDITYRFKTSTAGLERDANGSSEVVFENMANEASLIRYFDTNGIELTAGSTGLAAPDRARVRRVRIDLALRANANDPSSGLPLRTHLTTDVDLRNRFFGTDVTCP